MARAKKKTIDNKYEQELNQVIEQINFHSNCLSELEEKMNGEVTKSEQLDLWEEIKLTKKELKRWQSKYERLEANLENEAYNSNARLKGRNGGWN